MASSPSCCWLNAMLLCRVTLAHTKPKPTTGSEVLVVLASDSRCTGIEHPCFCVREYVARDWLNGGNGTVTKPAGFVNPEYKSSSCKWLPSVRRHVLSYPASTAVSSSSRLAFPPTSKWSVAHCSATQMSAHHHHNSLLAAALGSDQGKAHLDLSARPGSAITSFGVCAPVVVVDRAGKVIIVRCGAAQASLLYLILI
ncbi:hypothetical protein LZ30DRAFT_683406 [Colletotrichum cereale]|nr:hypothetical protein LZ30DRAFT_683406 [Colletotrichum cereale]